MTLTDPLHLRTTQRFIDQHPTTIVVTRTTSIPDGSGGRKKDNHRTMDPVVVRKVGSQFIAGSSNQVTPIGDVLIPTATLIAMPDVDLQKGDVFRIDGEPWKVEKTDRDPPWRLQAHVRKETA